MNKVLLVDDDAAIRMLYEEELSEEGYEVISSGEATEALELIRRENPDLVILDIKLASHSGLDLLQDIRGHCYDLPVILCTAYNVFKYDLRSIPADYYVVKSPDLTELKGKIRMALECVRSFREINPPGVSA